MKKINLIYWISTGLFAFIMFGSAIPDVLSVKIALDGFAKMGMPAYLVPFVGIAKVLGVIAILVPGYPRIKEWAYAGLMFDLLGAIYCVIASGQPVGSWAPMPVLFIPGILSYVYYHKKLKATTAGKGQIIKLAA